MYHISLSCSILVFGSFLCLLTCAQVCLETKLVWRDVLETYIYTSKRNVNPWCLFWCDEEVVSETKTRIVPKLVTDQHYECCEGYSRDYNKNSTGIHCEPICTPACVNGYCKSPGKCACNTGYTPNLDSANNCIPQCQDCNKGTCVAPNTCKCNNGFDLVNGTCEPECTEPCINGICIAPNSCQCDPGYKKENNICKPYCLDGSFDENCENTSTVTCDPGWQLTISGSCEPLCTTPCINATCVALDTCECIHGYRNVNTDACEPYCSSGCEHGTCIAPEICICDPGWYKIEAGGVCSPHCSQNCDNGTCVAPNECKCLPGYGKTGNEEKCEPLCPDCKGDCVEVYECDCESPYEVKNITNDALPCECFKNCTETNLCNNTICVTSITTDATVFEEYDVITDIYENLTSILHNDSNTTNGDANNTIGYDEFTIKKATRWDSGWFYGSAVLILISIIFIIIAVIKRRNKRFKMNTLTEITAM